MFDGSRHQKYEGIPDQKVQDIEFSLAEHMLRHTGLIEDKPTKSILYVHPDAEERFEDFRHRYRIAAQGMDFLVSTEQTIEDEIPPPPLSIYILYMAHRQGQCKWLRVGRCLENLIMSSCELSWETWPLGASMMKRLSEDGYFMCDVAYLQSPQLAHLNWLWCDI
jgi:hypothetical protein